MGFIGGLQSELGRVAAVVSPTWECFKWGVVGPCVALSYLASMLRAPRLPPPCSVTRPRFQHGRHARSANVQSYRYELVLVLKRTTLHITHKSLTLSSPHSASSNRRRITARIFPGKDSHEGIADLKLLEDSTKAGRVISNHRIIIRTTSHTHSNGLWRAALP